MGFAEKAIISSVLTLLAVLISSTVIVYKLTHPQPLAPSAVEPVAQIVIVSPTSTPFPVSTPALTPTPKPTRRPGTVRLKAASGDSIVQMFGSLTSDAGVVATFASGTECTKSGGPRQIAEGGISMSFYRLTCNGRSGYVNTKWVN